jgi:isoamylase
MSDDVLLGKSFPLGATIYPDGTNFCIFSKYATRIELLLFDRANDPKPSRVIALDAKRNKTFHYWHVFIKGVKAGQIYAYRACGPFEPDKGHRFDRDKVLLDPYARAIAGEEIYDRDVAITSEHLRLGRRSPFATSLLQQHYLRNARRRFYPQS